MDKRSLGVGVCECTVTRNFFMAISFKISDMAGTDILGIEHREDLLQGINRSGILGQMFEFIETLTIDPRKPYGSQFLIKRVKVQP